MDRFEPSFVEKAFNILNNYPGFGVVTSNVKRKGINPASFVELEAP